MTVLANPAVFGSVPFDSVIYASSGVNYSAVPQLNQYSIYDSPDPAYVTGRIDLSAFAELGSAPWPFSNANVPINGHLVIPQGRGPFPVAVFAHGNHDRFENSTPGYLYLCTLLASHGIIAATIDVNFLNGFNFGENDARAIVHLEHLKQLRFWNGQAAHPLQGKVDLNRLVIVGHSRGGEAVGHASYFNRLPSIQPDVFSPVVPLDGTAGLGPYRFGLRMAIAIAPTDRQYEPLSGPTVVPDHYHVIHGSRDGDVSSFEGYNTYNRTHAVDLANPTVSDGKLKSLSWIYRANHNQFNSVWPSETLPGVAMVRADQEQILKVLIGTLAKAVLLDGTAYFEVLRDQSVAATWLPSHCELVSQFQDPERIFLLHNQESPSDPEISLPVQGTIAADSVVATRLPFDLVNAGAPQTTITLQLQWNSLGARFTLNLDASSFSAERYRYLALRVGQSTEANNPVERDQDFTLEIATGARILAIPASASQRLRYPDVFFGAAKIVMQSLRFPMSGFEASGVVLSDIRSISLVFDRRATGTLYLGDVQITN